MPQPDGIGGQLASLEARSRAAARRGRNGYGNDRDADGEPGAWADEGDGGEFSVLRFDRGAHPWRRDKRPTG